MIAVDELAHTLELFAHRRKVGKRRQGALADDQVTQDLFLAADER